MSLFTPAQLKEIQDLIDQGAASGSGFPNPITAGNILLLTQLILQGSNTALLVYNGTPAFGNLVTAIGTGNGTDQFGNHWNTGLTFPPDDGSFNAGRLRSFGGIGGLRLSLEGPGDGTANGVADITMYGANTGAAGLIALLSGAASGAAIDFSAQNGGYISTSGPEKHNAGIIGQYYTEEQSFSGFSLPNAVQTNLTPQSQTRFDSDYTSGWSGATWTCPIASWWDGTAFARSLGGTTPNLRFLVNGVIVSQITTTGDTHFNKYLAAGDTVQVSAFQNSGVASILVAGSYATLRREL